jgi:hypothetical protein
MPQENEKELERELHRAWDEARDWKANVIPLRQQAERDKAEIISLRRQVGELEQEALLLQHRLRRETAATAAATRLTRVFLSITALAVMLWCVLG